MRKNGITGEMFLRLNDTDLEAWVLTLLFSYPLFVLIELDFYRMDIDELSRAALLSSSSTLRGNIPRGRSLTDVAYDLHATPNATKGNRYRNSNHTHYSGVASDNEEGALSSSSVLKFKWTGGNFRNGRVKGMVENFERTRSGSVSGSEGSEGGRSKRSRSQSGSSLDVDDRSALRDGMPGGDSAEEPTVEALLRTEKGSWGARAWEDTHLGETVKRVVGEHSDPIVNGSKNTRDDMYGSADLSSTNLEKVDTLLPERDPGRDLEGSGGINKSWGNGFRRGKGRQVVSAIFLGDKEVDAGVQLESDKSTQEAAESVEQVQALMVDELNQTRTLMEVFRRRLEEVEGRVAEMEERERHAERERKMAEMAGRTQKQESRLPFSFLRPYTVFARVLSSLSPFSTSSLSSPLSTSTSPAPNLHPIADTNNTNADKSALYRALFPTTLSALPSYIILVTVGMCAVVVQVLVRRAIGRRRGWRT